MRLRVAARTTEVQAASSWRRRSGAPSPGNPIRLFDERDAEPHGPGRLRRAGKIGRRDPAAGSVTEHETGHRRVDRMEMRPGKPVRSVELEDQPSLTSRSPQATAFFTSVLIFASSAAVSFVSANATGHIEPSSSLALSLKPSIAYRSLNFPASRKKQTTFPSLA